MGERINPVFYANIVIERITVKVAEIKDVPLQGKAWERCSNIGFDKGNTSESDKALKMLHKKHNVSIVYVFSHQNYLILSVCSVKIRVEVAQIVLFPSLSCVL